MIDKLGNLDSRYNLNIQEGKMASRHEPEAFRKGIAPESQGRVWLTQFGMAEGIVEQLAMVFSRRRFSGVSLRRWKPHAVARALPRSYAFHLQTGHKSCIVVSYRRGMLTNELHALNALDRPLRSSGIGGGNAAHSPSNSCSKRPLAIL